MNRKSSASILAVIPARYNSSRFPGKPLAPIYGKTLIQHTYENALRCPLLDCVVVATDDERIFRHVEEFGGKAVLTSSDCVNGTDRVVEVIRDHADYRDAEIILNIQGDEPVVPPELLTALVSSLVDDPSILMSTPVVPVPASDAMHASIVTCVFDQNHQALYFSRATLPSSKNGGAQGTVYQHIGIYAYRREAVLKLSALPNTPLQEAEDLEQLKALEYGVPIRVVIGSEPSIGVDSPEDVVRVEELLCKRSLSLSQEALSPR